MFSACVCVALKAFYGSSSLARLRVHSYLCRARRRLSVRARFPSFSEENKPSKILFSGSQRELRLLFPSRSRARRRSSRCRLRIGARASRGHRVEQVPPAEPVERELGPVAPCHLFRGVTCGFARPARVRGPSPEELRRPRQVRRDEPGEKQQPHAHGTHRDGRAAALGEWQARGV